MIKNTNIKSTSIKNHKETAPFLDKSKTCIKLDGNSATIPTNINKEIPLPIPFCVILSPSHIRAIVPPTRVNTVVHKNNLDSLIKTDLSKFENA